MSARSTCCLTPFPGASSSVASAEPAARQPRRRLSTELAPLRQIILDTETTGLNARLGDRIIEIAGVELVNRRLTGNHFHRYVNPEREIEEGALKVHGLTTDFLADKPKFSEIAGELIEFVRGAELIIHNAAFDVEFLNEEFGRLALGTVEEIAGGVLDTLAQARQLHPGRKNSLDALCERYAIDNSHRTLHGALLDASLLAEVYLAMTRGQESLAIDLEPVASGPITIDSEVVATLDFVVLVAAEDEGEIVGCATAAPLGSVDPAFAAPFLARGLDIATVFYCGESVLRASHRGRGLGHAFFDAREAHARALGGFKISAFCGVVRPAGHPSAPADYVPLDAFWRKRGYRKAEGMTCTFTWKDVDQPKETAKTMQFWTKDL